MYLIHYKMGKWSIPGINHGTIAQIMCRSGPRHNNIQWASFIKTCYFFFSFNKYKTSYFIFHVKLIS